MIERLQTYLDLLASLCRTAVAAAGPGLFDLLMTFVLSGLALYGVYALLRGLDAIEIDENTLGLHNHRGWPA